MTALRLVAELMELAARTAPKTMGQDYIVQRVVEGEALQALGRGMIEHGRQKGIPGFERDGGNVLQSEAVLLVGLKDARTCGLNCGACGEEVCLEINTHEGELRGPQCALRLLDLGIALGSAVKTASLLNADNRIMYRAGVVARAQGLIDADVVMGVPLAAAGKSPYFDRPAVPAPAVRVG